MKRAFTLIELLVVIAIIAILAALLFPVFAQAKLAAKKTVDISNLKQQSLALVMYHNDWDDQLVHTSTDIPEGQAGDVSRVYWIQFVYPYVKNAGVFVSPVDPQPQTVDLIDVPVKFNSYISNYAVMALHDYRTVNAASIGDLSSVIFLTQRRSLVAGGLAPYKGTSGFWPGEPCTVGTYARSFSEAPKPKGGIYVRMTEAQARADLPVMMNQIANDKINLLDRAFWDIYGNGAVYAMGDGHAQFMAIGRTLNPSRFLWGEKFYAEQTLPGEDPLNPHGGDCD